MALSPSAIISAAIPADFKAALIANAQSGVDPVTNTAFNFTLTAEQSGSVGRTIIALLAEVMAKGFGVAATIGGQFAAIGKDGILATFLNGRYLKFASSVTPDPSSANPDGTYPAFGTGWLDAVAEGFNVARNGGPNGGIGAEPNASVVARCTAKLATVGATIATLSNTDAFDYLATDPSVGGAYAGATLTAPMTRAQAVVQPGLTNLYLANGSGLPPGADVLAEHNFLQAGLVSLGTTLIVQAATGVNAAVTCDVYVPAKYTAQAQNDVIAAITAYINSVPIGGAKGVGVLLGVPLDALEAAIINTVTYVQSVNNLKINGTAADLNLAPGQCAVAIPAPVVTVHLV